MDVRVNVVQFVQYVRNVDPVVDVIVDDIGVRVVVLVVLGNILVVDDIVVRIVDPIMDIDVRVVVHDIDPFVVVH